MAVSWKPPLLYEGFCESLASELPTWARKNRLLEGEPVWKIVYWSGLFAFAFLLELTLVGEGHFEHLEAEPESARAGQGGVACDQEHRAFFIAWYVRLEPESE